MAERQGRWLRRVEGGQTDLGRIVSQTAAELSVRTERIQNATPRPVPLSALAPKPISIGAIQLLIPPSDNATEQHETW